MTKIKDTFKKELTKAYGSQSVDAKRGSEYYGDLANSVNSLEEQDDQIDDILSLLDQIVSDEEKNIEGETKEAMGSGSAGGYVGPMKVSKEETKEATGSDSSGAYDVAFGAPRKDPLKIDNPGLKKIKEDRIKIPSNVKGKNKKNRYGGPDGVFVKVKDKCKTYPYCNQGDINALEFYEDERDNSKNKDTYKKSKVMKEIKNYIENIVDKVLKEQSEVVAESVTSDLDEMEEFYEIAKQRKLSRMEEKNEKPDFPDIDGDGDTEEPISKAAKDKEKKEVEETEMEEGNAYSGARCKAGCSGKKSFEVGGETIDLEDWSDEDKKNCDCENLKESKKTVLTLTETEVIDLIEKIIQEDKVEGISDQTKSMKQSQRDNESYYKEVAKKLKDYNKGYQDEGKTMPKTSGEIEKMDKVAYEPNEEAEEYIEDFSYGSGLTGLDYDGLEPDEERQKDYLEGSSKTGNASVDEKGDNLGNAVESDAGKKFNDIRKRKAFAKSQSEEGYNKDPQPVVNVKEEIDRYKEMINFQYKSQ
jgi:hypothetical protein